MQKIRAVFFSALSVVSMSFQALAQDVTLSSLDGTMEVSGDLRGFDGEFYRIATRFGELTIDGSGVRCDGPGCPSLSDFVAEITLAGSSTMAEVLLPALIEGFSLRNGYQTKRTDHNAGEFEYTLLGANGLPTMRFHFIVSNTDDGFLDLLSDEADMVMALREIRDEERAAAAKAGLGDMTKPSRSRVLALDAMVPIVSPENPVRKISVPQIADIFAGHITNWQELGGADAPIALHLPVQESGLAQAFEDKILHPAKLTLAEEIRRHERGSTLVRRVTTDPFAIGIASYAETETARVLTLTGSCGFSLSADRRSIKTEDYPLTAPMFLYLPARRLPRIAREFLTYLRSSAAQVVIRRAGFVDQSAEHIPLALQGERLANAVRAAGPQTSLSDLQRMVTAMDGMQRLTVSFRFEAGSTRLDAQSRSNVEILAQDLETGVYDARTLVFSGFSDGEGPAEANQKIAYKRAEAVKKAVIDAAETANLNRINIQVDAFGEALPMACDASEWGRQVNRRVEVWVR